MGGPTPDLETAGDKDADPMSPLVSQIVEIRQFIKKFRRSLADEEIFLNSSPNTVSNNSETVEVTGKRISSERSSPHRLKRNCSLRERNLVDQNGRNQDQDGGDEDQDQIGKGGLFWASPAYVKEEVDLPVISPRKKKVSVTSFTTKKVSVTSPDWNNDKHHTFV